MEVHRQQCQKCSSHNLRVILAREAGHPQAVYVRCGDCGELVAFYKLNEYYHHGKGFESFLRSQQARNSESGRDMLEEFERVRHEALEGYQRVLAELEKQGKPV